MPVAGTLGDGLIIPSAPTANKPASAAPAISLEQARAAWTKCAGTVSAILQQVIHDGRVVDTAPGLVILAFGPGKEKMKSWLDKPRDRSQLEQALSRAAGRPLRLQVLDRAVEVPVESLSQAAFASAETLPPGRAPMPEDLAEESHDGHDDTYHSEFDDDKLYRFAETPQRELQRLLDERPALRTALQACEAVLGARPVAVNGKRLD